ncbi:MAG TPA: hypothetical protein VGJ53_06060 [Micromonosporaceae bacterium]|jgi:hypothetical protein
MPDLDERLARGRVAVLDAIDQPPLEALQARATTRRHRRASIRAGAALAVVVGVALAVVRPWSADPGPAPDVATERPPRAVYTDAGITVNGLDSLGDVHEMPGAITDVEFPDADRGYAIACDASSCTIGRTSDGGLTWQSNTLPAAMGRAVDMLPFPGDALVVTTHGRAHSGWISFDGGQTWRLAPAATGTPVIARKGEILRLADSGGVEVWSPRAGYRGDLADPPIDVRWVASVPTATGAWWVGGVDRGTGRPAIAVTADGGARWTKTVLDGAGQDASSVQVSVLGSHAYAMVLAGNGPWPKAVVAIFHSADGGKHFTLTRAPGAKGGPPLVSGALIPLLDGRLLVAGGNHRWYVSPDDGATFTLTGEHLPAVSRLGMTPGGYVAYNLFNTEWAAFSSDGSTWRKLRTH